MDIFLKCYLTNELNIYSHHIFIFDIEHQNLPPQLVQTLQKFRPHPPPPKGTHNKFGVKFNYSEVLCNNIRILFFYYSPLVVPFINIIKFLDWDIFLLDLKYIYGKSVSLSERDSITGGRNSFNHVIFSPFNITYGNVLRYW